MPSWPNDLPQFVLEQGFAEKNQDQAMESKMDVGPVKIRRRFTGAYKLFQVSVMMTSAQVDTFDSFWNSTLSGGTLSFTWVHPRSRAAATFRFRNPAPSRTAAGGTNMVVSFTLEQTG